MDKKAKRQADTKAGRKDRQTNRKAEKKQRDER
jgi:hypothetical protein